MKSMTGFGHAERAFDLIQISVDIKTTNGRYLDMNLRLPRELSALEGEVRKEIQNRLSRGRVEGYINLTAGATDQYQLDEPTVHNYVTLAQKTRDSLGEGVINLLTLFQLPGVIRPRQFESSEESLRAVLEVVREALDKVESTRSLEGASLKAELEKRLQNLEQLVDQVAAGTRRISDYYRDKLTQRVHDLMRERAVDENRLAQEVLYYAERYDVSEEIARLRSHIQRFRQYLDQSEQEHVGKNLDFLCQEMNREMNTILSKSPVADLSEIGVEGKAEIEKIREQVQNVE